MESIVIAKINPNTSIRVKAEKPENDVTHHFMNLSAKGRLYLSYRNISFKISG
jgi:hypothetical protein